MANPILIGWQVQMTMSPAEAPPPLEQFKGWQMVIPPTFSDTFPLNGLVPGGGAQIIGSPIVQPVGRTSV